jgi:hypothetical protein
VNYLFTYLVNSPKANYKVSTSTETNKANTYTQTQTKQDNVYHLDNNYSIGAIMATAMRWQETHHHHRKNSPSIEDSARLHPVFTSLDLVTIIVLQNTVVTLESNPQLGGPCLCIYISPRKGGPAILPGMGFPIRRLLWLAGLRSRYSYMLEYPYDRKKQFKLYII